MGTLLALFCGGLRASAATDQKGPASAAASAGKAREARLVEIPKSVFNPVQGRNPFFPASSVPPIQPGSGTQTSPKPTPVDQLVLNGLVPDGDHPTAMVNGHTFAKGETAEVRVPNGTKILIKCEEIRAESVIISIEGQMRELKLRAGAF